MPIKTTTSARHTILDHREWIAKPGTLARTNQSMRISWPGGGSQHLLGNNAQLYALTMLLLTTQNWAQLRNTTSPVVTNNSKFSLNKHRFATEYYSYKSTHHAPRTTSTISGRWTNFTVRWLRLVPSLCPAKQMIKSGKVQWLYNVKHNKIHININMHVTKLCVSNSTKCFNSLTQF